MYKANNFEESKSMRKLSSLLLFILLSLSFANGQLNIDYWLNSGTEKIIKNDNLAAIEYFNTIIRFNPDLADAFYLRGISKYNLKDYRGAIEDLSKAIQYNPIFANYYLYRGNAKQKLYDFKGAKEDYDKAIEVRPISTDAYLSRGINYIIVKKYDDAIKDFDMAIELSRSNPYAYLYRAIGKQYEQKNEEAMVDFDKAIQLDPYNNDAYVRRGRNRCEMKDFKGGIEDFNKALSIDSTNSFAYFNRALAYSESNDVNDALADYNKVLKLDPENDITYFNRAELKAKKGDLTGAISDYDNVVKINPTNVYTYFNRAIAYQKLGKNNKAIADYTNAINLNPEFANAYFNRSIAKHDVNDLAGADLDYKTAVRLNKDLNKLNQAGLLDSTGLSKITEFRADFEAGNVQVAKSAEMGIYPFPIFDLVFALKDSLKNYQPTDLAKLPVLNKDNENGDRFVLTRDPITISQDSAEHLLSLIENVPFSEKNYPLIFERASLKSQLQNFNGAIDDYNIITTFMPDLSLGYFCKANTNYDMITFLNSIQDVSGNIVASNTNTKVQKVTIQNYDDVIADYNKCLKLNPKFYYGYYNMANVMIESREFKGAIDAFGKAIDIEPKFAEAYYNRGLTYIFIKEKDTGCLDLSKAGELGITKAYAVIKKYCNN